MGVKLRRLGTVWAIAGAAFLCAVVLSGMNLVTLLPIDDDHGHASGAPGATAIYREGEAGSTLQPAAPPPPLVIREPRSSLRASSEALASGSPYVVGTLVLGNNTLVPGNYVGNGGQAPTAVVFDSGTGEIFVANFNAGNVMVISNATDKVAAIIPVGALPDAEAYDSGLGEVFVANFGSADVSVISDAIDAVVATVPVGQGPAGLAYDGDRGEVFVANSESNTVSILSDTTNTVVKNLTVGSGPEAVTYDSGVQEAFVVNGNTDTLSEISSASNTVVGTVNVGYYPEAVEYDSGQHEIFVANDGTPSESRVRVVSDATDAVVASVTVGKEPAGLAYDGVDGEVFVSNANSSTVSIISASTNLVVASLTVGNAPQGVAYDSANGWVYVANSDSGTISILSPSSRFIPAPPLPYPVTFQESGLPSGTLWEVTVNGTAHSSTNDTVSFLEKDGSYSYSIGTVPGYNSTPPSTSITVKGVTLFVTVTFEKVSIRSSGSGLSALDSAVVGLGAIAAVLWGVLLLLRWRGKAPPASRMSPPNGGSPPAS